MAEPITSIAEAKRELKKVHSSATSTDWYMARCFPLMMELYQQSQPKPKQKRKPSEYNLFMGEQMRKGKSLQEVAKMWNRKKELLSA